MIIVERAIQYVRTYFFTRQWKKRQNEWQKIINLPKRITFCPLLYDNCVRTNGNDTNCFVSKAPGCPIYINHIKLLIQNENPRAHVMNKDALEYIAEHSSHR